MEVYSLQIIVLQLELRFHLSEMAERFALGWLIDQVMAAQAKPLMSVNKVPDVLFFSRFDVALTLIF